MTQEMKIIEPESYGAKGDGVTDDYAAVTAAIEAAGQGNAEIRFQPGATYYLATPNEQNCAVALFHKKNLTLKGDNTTLMIDNLYTYIDVQYSEDVRIEGFNFSYRRAPYTIGKVVDVDLDNRTMVVKTKESLQIEDRYVPKIGDCFALPLIDYGRLHMFFDAIDVIDAGENLYLYRFRPGADGIDDRLRFMAQKDKGLLVPMPYVGQVEGSAFLVTYTTNLTYQNCNVYHASHFCFHMRYNQGQFNIINVNFVPDPHGHGAMVGWRDGFHLKENRCKFLFDNCDLKGVFDDIFNLSCTMLTVDKVYSETEFNMSCREFGGTYYMQYRPGDELLLLNSQNGDFVGLTKIKEVVEQNGPINRVIVEDPLPLNKPEDVHVSITTLAQPCSLIRNCKVDGTFRLRTPVTFENCDLRVCYSWVENEPPHEGALPKDILFKNCKIYGLREEFRFMSFGAVTMSGAQPKYQVRNVVFEDCDINPQRIFIRPGNEIIFKKDGKILEGSVVL